MFHYWKTLIATRMPRTQKGQDTAEYALLIGFIALLVVAGAMALGGGIGNFFSTLGTTIGGWTVP